MKYIPRFGGMALVLCLFCVGGQAQEEAAVVAAPLEFILRPVHDGFNTSLITGDREEVVFKAEPEYAGAAVYRQAIRYGDGPSDYMGMAYDSTARLLYIDRNRNLDLTDDGPGVAADGSESWQGNFSDVMIELVHDGIPVHYVLDFSFFGDFYFSAVVRSGWRGEVEIAGQQCVVGFSDNLNGLFNSEDSFTFDHDRNRAARLSCGTVDSVQLPRWLYFSGHNYTIEAAFRVLDEETVVVATLTPITDDLMDIRFEGQYVSRVLLRDSSDAYGMLDWPVPEMQIPKGNYAPRQVDLLDSFTGQLGRRAARLEPEGNTLLKTGGPVNQDISVVRNGTSLSLGYTLRGEDGTRYEANVEEENPRFAVYKGDNKVASGQFEYG